MHPDQEAEAALNALCGVEVRVFRYGVCVLVVVRGDNKMSAQRERNTEDLIGRVQRGPWESHGGARSIVLVRGSVRGAEVLAEQTKRALGAVE